MNTSMQATRWIHQSTLLRTARLKSGKSQLDMDRIIGSARPRGQCWSNWERAKSGIPHKHINKVCETLGIPKDELRDAITRDFTYDLNREIYG